MKTSAFHNDLYEGPLLTRWLLILFLLLLDHSVPATLGTLFPVRSFFIVFFYFPSRLSQGHIWVKLTLGILYKRTNPLLHSHLQKFLPCWSPFLFSLDNGSFLTLSYVYRLSISHQKTSTLCSEGLVCSLVYLKHLDQCLEYRERFDTYLLNKWIGKADVYICLICW